MVSMFPIYFVKKSLMFGDCELFNIINFWFQVEVFENENAKNLCLEKLVCFNWIITGVSTRKRWKEYLKCLKMAEKSGNFCNKESNSWVATLIIVLTHFQFELKH